MQLYISTKRCSSRPIYGRNMRCNSDGVANKVINTNFTGVVNILLAFMPFFKSQRSGNIIVLGSVAGDRGRLSNYIYGSSKSGIHTFLQGFRSEMEKIGVNVTNIKLGPIDTRMSYGAGFDKIMIIRNLFS